MGKTFIEIYKDLASIDCSSFTEKKKDLIYLSWAHAYNIVASRYDTRYEVVKFDWKPYFFDESLGYYVETTVTIEWHSRTMQLFVMDGANNAMTNDQYSYTTKYGDKTVEKATMFEINTAIMRCLTKNLAIFGLGINIYAGEDLPMIDSDGNTVTKAIKTTPKTNTSTGGTAIKYFWVKDLERCEAEWFANGKESIKQWASDNWLNIWAPMQPVILKYLETWEITQPIFNSK